MQNKSKLTRWQFYWLRHHVVSFSVRPSTPFSTDTDTLIFCCQPIPIRYRSNTDTLQERPWRSVTDRSKAPDAATATNNSGGTASAAADAFDLWWTVKHSNYQ